MTERKRGEWGTPSAILVLSMILGFAAWTGNDILSQLRTSIDGLRTDMKQSNQKLWEMARNDSLKEQKDFSCLAQGLARCCKEATECV